MPRHINPATHAAPASNYSQGVVHKAGAERLVISGQVGVLKDGTAVKGMAAQCKQACTNFLSVLADAGFLPSDVVKVTVFVTQPALKEFRTSREEALKGHAPAATYVEIKGLASPDYLVEIEGEAVRG